MTAFVIRRLASLLFVLWGAVTLLFFLFFLLPSDPAELIAGRDTPAIRASEAAEVRILAATIMSLLISFCRTNRSSVLPTPNPEPNFRPCSASRRLV